MEPKFFNNTVRSSQALSFPAMVIVSWSAAMKLMLLAFSPLDGSQNSKAFWSSIAVHSEGLCCYHYLALGIK